MVYIVPIFFAVVYFAIVYINAEAPGETISRSAESEVVRYRIFVSTASEFFKIKPAPSVLTSYRWDDIKEFAPIGHAQQGMRLDWKVVRNTDGTWAACTELSEMAVAQLNGIFASAPIAHASAPTQLSSIRIQPIDLVSGGSGLLGLNNASAGDNGVIGIGTKTEAAGAANLCDSA